MSPKGPQTRSSDAQKETITNFASELKSFLLDEENKKLLQAVICVPLMDEIKELKELLSQKDDTITKLSDQISALEQKNDDLEQYTRRNSLRISGIKENPKEDCYQVVLDLANSTLELDPPLTLTDIDRTHRSGTPQADRVRPILVKFATYRQRQRCMHQRSALRRKLPNVYFNEDLTAKRSAVMWSARQAKKAKKIDGCWSSDGRLFIRTNSGTTHLIKDENDLDSYLSRQTSQTSPN